MERVVDFLFGGAVALPRVLQDVALLGKDWSLVQHQHLVRWLLHLELEWGVGQRAVACNVCGVENESWIAYIIAAPSFCLHVWATPTAGQQAAVDSVHLHTWACPVLFDSLLVVWTIQCTQCEHRCSFSWLRPHLLLLRKQHGLNRIINITNQPDRHSTI
jgi:hypothetical protein